MVEKSDKYFFDILFYLIDFGSESLGFFNKFPQVGDIVYSGEEDKLSKLYKRVALL